MLPKLQAHVIQAYTDFKSADGSKGVTALEAGIQFKNGLYVGGTFSAAGLPLTTDNITISGTAGNGYIQYGAQTVKPSLALVHNYADSGGHFAIGGSGSSAYDISFTNSLMTADRNYAFQDKAGTLAMTNDNLSQFTNDAGFVVGPGSAVSGRIASFNGTTGKLVQDSGILASSVVLNTRTLTEGAGLAGNTYDLSANRTLTMGTPSTLSVVSTNAASGTTHTHLITSSSNPGAAAALLSSNGSGYLQLVRVGIGIAPTQPLHVAGNAFIDAATANLYMKDTSTGLQVATTLIVTPQSGNSLRSVSFTSGVNGWTLDPNYFEAGNGRFRGELAASVFKINEISATAGTLGVFWSASTLFNDFTTPSSTGTAFTFDAKNSDAGIRLFSVGGDIVRFKSWTGAGVSDAWATITNAVDHGTYTTYTATLNSGSTSATFRAGTAVVDYGQSGTGFITLSTDGTVGSSPNMTMATHAGSPWSAQTTLLRLGNLNGSYGYVTDVYGLGIGQYGTASKSWQTLDQTSGLRIGNNTTVLGQWDVSGNATFGQVATNKANVYWNASNSRLEFRGSTSGTVVQSYIDTDGSFVAGGGLTKLDASGLHLESADQLTTGTGTGNTVTWLNGANETGKLYHSHDNTSHYSELVLESLSRSSDTSGYTASYLVAVNNSNLSASIGVFTRNSAAGNDGRINFYGSSNFTGVVIGSAGTTLPAHMLDVYGTGWFQSDLTVGEGGTGTTVRQIILNGPNGTGGGPQLTFQANSVTGCAIGTERAIAGGAVSNTKLTFYSTSSTYRLYGLGAGTVTTDASGNISITSDERLKIVTGVFTKGLDALRKLKPIRYRWRKDSGMEHKSEYVGFGARHTKRHIPEAVGKGANGFHTLSDRVILATLVNAVKELEQMYATR